MASKGEWLQFHQNHNNVNNNTTTNNTPSAGGQVAPPYASTSPSDLFFPGRLNDATVVSTPTNHPPPGPGPAQLGPEGRVSKPARRRTRASRRTPTTLLNTDTANFRAMVQQFTGGPSNSFSSLGGLGPNGFSIGPGTGPGLGYGVQFPNVGQLQFSSMPSSINNSINNNHQGLHHHTNAAGDSNNNNAMFMQRMGDHNNNAYITSHNVNMNAGLGAAAGTGGGSSSSENRSSNSFQY